MPHPQYFSYLRTVFILLPCWSGVKTEVFSKRVFGCFKDRKIFLKNLCFTVRKIEASEFLIPMIDIAPSFLLTKLRLWSYSGSVHFNSPEKKTPGSHWIKVWVAPQLMWKFWRKENLLPFRGIDPRMVLSVDCPNCLNNNREKFKYEFVTVARVMLLISVMWYRAVWSVDADVSEVPTACVTWYTIWEGVLYFRSAIRFLGKGLNVI
jgi:hypothetical protein